MKITKGIPKLYNKIAVDLVNKKRQTFIAHHYLNEWNIMQPPFCFAQLGALLQRQEEECPLVCCVEVLYYRWTNTHRPDVCSRGHRVRLHWIETIFHQITLVRIPAVGRDQKHSSLAADHFLPYMYSFLLFVQLLLLQCNAATPKVEPHYILTIKNLKFCVRVGKKPFSIK